MSETATVTTPTVYPSIERNDTALQLVEGVFGNKSKDNKGKKYPYAPFDVEHWDNNVKWFGQQTICDAMNNVSRRIGQDIFLDAVDKETGEIDWELLVAKWQDFTAGGYAKSEIEDQLDELQEIQYNLAQDPAFGTEEEVTLADGTKDMRPTEAWAILGQKIRENNAKMMPLKAKLQEVEKKLAAAAEKRAATKAAKKTPVVTSK